MATTGKCFAGIERRRFRKVIANGGRSQRDAGTGREAQLMGEVKFGERAEANVKQLTTQFLVTDQCGVGGGHAARRNIIEKDAWPIEGASVARARSEGATQGIRIRG